MALQVAVQMDPIEKISIAGDTTFALMLEAAARGHALHYYRPENLSLRDGRVVAYAAPVAVRDIPGAHFSLEPAQAIDLATMDVVLLRQDPPFDLAYITSTHILERLAPGTLVVNDPVSVRNAPEKLFVMDYPELMPATLITRDRAEIDAFRRQHGEVVMKPLHGHGGIFRVQGRRKGFQLRLALRPVLGHVPRAMGGAGLSQEHRARRQADHPRRRRAARRRQPRAGGKRHPLQHGARGRRERNPVHRPRTRDLRDDRSRTQAPRPPARGDRRDRRLSHRDQRDLADRHPGDQACRRPGSGGRRVGRHRDEARGARDS